MKKTLLTFLALFITHYLVYSQCDISDDYSSNTGWTQVGSNVQISNNKVEFINGAADGEQRRVYKNLGVTLDETDCWVSEFTFTPVSVGSASGQPMVGHIPFALTAGNQEPFNNCPDIPCTGFPTGVQDGIMLLFGTDNPPNGNVWFKIKVRDGSVEYTSANQINIPTFGISYYIKLEKKFSDIHLSVFTDSTRISHLAGSPISLLNIPSTVSGLNTIQHSAVARGWINRQLTGSVDDLCINLDIDCIRSAGNLSYDSLNICLGDSITLSDPAYYIRQWALKSAPNTIISTDTTITVSPTSISRYLAYGVYDTTEFVVNVSLPPVIDIGADTTICYGDTINLSTSVTNAAYLWQDGSSGSSLNASQSGTYWLQVTQNSCVISDTVIIDTMICGSYVETRNICLGDSITLSDTRYQVDAWALKSAPTVIISTDSILTVTPVVTTRYLAYGANDTTEFIVNVEEAPVVNLGVDTSLCAGETLTLDATANKVTYLWQDGSGDPIFNVTQPGTYWVELTNNCGVSSDTINVAYSPLPIIDMGNDTVLCSGESFILDATTLNATYLWQDGSIASTYNVTQLGIYWVTISVNNCSASDTVTVNNANCEIRLELPNIFTPNGDGINDVFIPVVNEGIISMRTTVYNRWGTVIFSSDFLGIEWDGFRSPSGVYYWTVQYTDVNNNTGKFTGNVTIVR